MCGKIECALSFAELELKSFDCEKKLAFNLETES